MAFRLSADCASEPGQCGDCRLNGLAAGAGHCFLDVSRRCSQDAECAGGHCVDLLGAPLPTSTAGAPACLLAEIRSIGPGDFSRTGATTVPLLLRWTYFEGFAVDNPCPRCDGASIGSAGICHGGDHDGQACTVDATNEALGNTSFDCPPTATANVGTLDLPMVLTTETSSLLPNHACVSDPFGAVPCYCSEQPLPNTCLDGNCVAGTSGDTVCETEPRDGYCVIQDFRPCLSDNDCPAAGDQCTIRPRQCLGLSTPTGGITDPLVRSGHGGTTEAVLVSTFCVPPGTNTFVNAGLGLPAPAAMTMPVAIDVVDACAVGASD